MEEKNIATDFYCRQVLSGKTAVRKVMETDNVLAFHHTKPCWPVHIIVIPKVHVDNMVTLFRLRHDLLDEMMDVLSAVIDMVRNENGGCRLTTNFGTLQATKHLHWHVYVSERMME